MLWPEWSFDRIMRERPAVRVNQLGYLPGHPMQATMICESPDPIGFAVCASDGGLVISGTSEVWPVRPEPTLGLTVHRLDFTGLDRSGDGFRVEAAGVRSHPFAIRTDLYDSLAREALSFFRLMRSGAPVPASLAPGYERPAGHLGLVLNTGDTAVPAWAGPDADRLYPGWQCAGTFDVSGGWYDAGDYGKYVTSGSLAAWQLLSVLDAGHPSPSLARALADECRWQLDWLMRMQVPPSDDLAGMAFHRVHGTRWSPVPGWPHEDPTTRVPHRPSTTVARGQPELGRRPVEVVTGTVLRTRA